MTDDAPTAEMLYTQSLLQAAATLHSCSPDFDPLEDPDLFWADRFIKYYQRRTEAPFAQLLQDIFVCSVLDGKHRGSFVEIGVGNGIDISNTYYLERNLAWSGILIEPNPTYADEIALNRPNSILVAKAVLDRGGVNMPFMIVEEDPLFSGLDQYYDAERRPKSPVREIKVEVAAVADVFREFGVSKSNLDYLSIDIEGADLLVLAAVLEAGYRPRIITVEHNFNKEAISCIRRLLFGDYRIVMDAVSKWDIWAIRRDVVSEAMQ